MSKEITQERFFKAKKTPKVCKLPSTVKLVNDAKYTDTDTGPPSFLVIFEDPPPPSSPLIG